ncbi:MAG: hypothetical protein ACYDH8_09695 [Syntrophales bacterium]
MTAFIDLERDIFENLKNGTKDPLDLIVRHKDIVKHLRGNGIDGMEIRNIFLNRHGLRMIVPVFFSEAAMKKHRNTSYAMRNVSALLSSDLVSNKEKDFLSNIMTRLSGNYSELESDKKGETFLKFHREQGGAKTHKQMIGRQVVELVKYIKRFNHMYYQNDIFDLIAEIYEVTDMGKFTRERIKNFDKNNC